MPPPHLATRRVVIGTYCEEKNGTGFRSCVLTNIQKTLQTPSRLRAPRLPLLRTGSQYPHVRFFQPCVFISLPLMLQQYYVGKVSFTPQIGRQDPTRSNIKRQSHVMHYPCHSAQQHPDPRASIHRSPIIAKRQPKIVLAIQVHLSSVPRTVEEITCIFLVPLAPTTKPLPHPVNWPSARRGDPLWFSLTLDIAYALRVSFYPSIGVMTGGNADNTLPHAPFSS